MIKVIGVLFILMALILLYGSHQRIYYNSSGQVIEKEGNIYAITDAIGIEYFVKEYHQFIPDQIIIIICSLLFYGFCFLYKALPFLSGAKISSLAISGIVVIALILIYFVNYYKGYYTFFHDRLPLLFSGLITLLIFSLFHQSWRIIHNKILPFIIYSYSYFIMGILIIIELGNYYEPFVHEGNWGQIDGNFIVIFWNDTFKHSWTFEYIIFRLSNLVLLLVCIYFTLQNTNYLNNSKFSGNNQNL